MSSGRVSLHRTHYKARVSCGECARERKTRELGHSILSDESTYERHTQTNAQRRWISRSVRGWVGQIRLRVRVECCGYLHMRGLYRQKQHERLNGISNLSSSETMPSASFVMLLLRLILSCGGTELKKYVLY